MQPVFSKGNVIENVKVSDGIYRLTMESGLDVNPGQFFMLKAWGGEPFLPRPISVHDADGSSISFLYEVRGSGTQILSSLKTGDAVEYTGPLGNGFDVEHIKGKVAIVTGGIGIAPMFYTAKMLKDTKVDLYAGFKSNPYLLGDIKNYVSDVYVSTDDGSYGHKGFITDIFSPWEYSAVLCCGPEVMMKKAAARCIAYATPIFISEESRMACGIGACLGCSCKTNTGMKRICKDGPVFSGREVLLNA